MGEKTKEKVRIAIRNHRKMEDSKEEAIQETSQIFQDVDRKFIGSAAEEIYGERGEMRESEGKPEKPQSKKTRKTEQGPEEKYQKYKRKGERQKYEQKLENDIYAMIKLLAEQFGIYDEIEKFGLPEVKALENESWMSSSAGGDDIRIGIKDFESLSSKDKWALLAEECTHWIRCQFSPWEKAKKRPTALGSNILLDAEYHLKYYAVQEFFGRYGHLLMGKENIIVKEKMKAQDMTYKEYEEKRGYYLKRKVILNRISNFASNLKYIGGRQVPKEVNLCFECAKNLGIEELDFLLDPIFGEKCPNCGRNLKEQLKKFIGNFEEAANQLNRNIKEMENKLDNIVELESEAQPTIDGNFIAHWFGYTLAKKVKKMGYQDEKIKGLIKLPEDEVLRTLDEKERFEGWVNRLERNTIKIEDAEGEPLRVVCPECGYEEEDGKRGKTCPECSGFLGFGGRSMQGDWGWEIKEQRVRKRKR